MQSKKSKKNNHAPSEMREITNKQLIDLNADAINDITEVLRIHRVKIETLECQLGKIFELLKKIAEPLPSIKEKK